MWPSGWGVKGGGVDRDLEGVARDPSTPALGSGRSRYTCTRI